MDSSPDGFFWDLNVKEKLPCLALSRAHRAHIGKKNHAQSA